MSTKMNPAEFHERLDSALREGDALGLGATVEGDVRLGRRLLRRRRGATLLGAVSVVAVAALAAGAVASTGGSTGGPTVAAAPTSAAELLAACRDGNQSDRATEAMFGGGDPSIKVETHSQYQTVLALEAADGRHWAWCWVGLKDAEFPAGMEVYDAGGTTRNSMYSSGAICRVPSACDRFSVTVVDRRPAEVAAVEFRTADGVRTTVESVDGYIVLNHVGTVPDGTSLTPEGLPVDFAAIERITFLDSNGNPIAAEAQDGSGGGPDGEWVAGLPSIREFPALRGGQAIH